MKSIRLIFIIFIISCNVTEKSDQIILKYNRFEQSLFSVDTKNIDSELDNLRKDFGSFTEIFEMQIMNKSNISENLYSEEVIRFINHPDMREAYDSVSLLFTDFSDIEYELNKAFFIFTDIFPSYQLPEITTFFGGFNYGVVTYDNNIAIGLENFLGIESKYYKLLGDPKYLRFQKQKKYIVPNVMEVWFNEHFEGYIQDRTFLSQLIYKGKVMLFIDQMLPEMNIADKFRFSTSEMDWVVQNEANIWSYFIDNEFLYSSNEQSFRSFLSYAPFAKGMPKEAPARVGYFIGYKIISDYIYNTNLTLNEVICEIDSRKLLKDSKYKPKK